MNIFRGILGIGLIFGIASVAAQSYFLALPDDPETFNRRINRFSNDDILIGDSSDEGVFSQANGKVFLTRIDNCGNLVWSFSYERTTEYLEFKDVVLNGQDVIFAYGSAYRGGQELLFLLKVSPDGRLLNFKLVNTGTVDHFSYTMDIRNGELMVYGLLLDYNTQKRGFVSIFNEGFEYKWGKSFAPFESEGDAIIDSHHRYICRSSFFHYALSREGTLIWALEVDQTTGIQPLAGPLELPDGYVFQAFHNGTIFFYKLDTDGNLMWQTKKIATLKFVADMILINGKIIALTKHALTDRNTLARLIIDPSSGQIEEQTLLRTNESMDVDHVYQSVDQKGNFRILGNKALLEKYPLDVPYFLMQFPPDQKANNCFAWEPVNLDITNNIPLLFNPIDTILYDAGMSVENTDGLITVLPYDFPMKDVCGFKIEPTVITVDTTLACGVDWEIQLPSDEFVWEDAPAMRDRILRSAGVYRAVNRDCLEPVVYAYSLDKPECSCNLYLPNAITVNQDGVNDFFEIYSDCSIADYQLTVFNRWGMKILVQKNRAWDGRHPDGHFEAGLYLIRIEYRLMDAGGKIQVGHQMQEVVLLR